MAERYQRLLKHDEPLYLKDSPVIIDAYALLKDTVTDEIKGQIKFLSVSKKRIKALTVKIFPKDAANKKIDKPFDFEYLDLSEDRDNYFGNKQAINMPNKSTREFDARVIRVIFTDNTEWNNDGLNEWIVVKRPVPLKSLLNSDLCEQFNLDYNKDPSLINLYDESNGLWYCSCGATNLADETTCHKCKESKEKLASYDFDEFLSGLKISKKESEEALAEARKKKEAEMAIKRQEQLKLHEMANEERSRKGRKFIKVYLPIGIVSIVLIITVILCAILIPPYVKYNKAIEFQDKDDLDNAICIFTELGDYKDSQQKVVDLSYLKLERLKEDKNYESIISLLNKIESTEKTTNQYMTTVYKTATFLYNEKQYFLAKELYDSINTYKDSSKCATLSWEKTTNEWNKFIGTRDTLWISGRYTAGIKKDGTVFELGYHNKGTSEWYNIISIAVNDSNDIAGLRADGKILCSNKELENIAEKWDNVVAIAYGETLIGLKKDGTVISSDEQQNNELSKWKNLVDVASVDDHVVGLKKDGTVAAIGNNENGKCNVSSWNNIVAISVGKYTTVGLQKDGKVIAVGNNSNGECNVSDWDDIKAISAGSFTTIGLKKDGTVVAVGSNKGHQKRACNVSEWKHIIDIEAGTYETVGITDKGRVVSTDNVTELTLMKDVRCKPIG